MVGRSPDDDARLVGLRVVPNPRQIEEVRAAIEAALATRRRPRPRPTDPFRVVVAVEDPRRCDALASALVRRGAGVIQVDDGLELLELLGRQVLQPNGWYPEVVVLDARMPRMDGIDALSEVRQFDRRLRAVVLADPEDEEARRVVPALTPAEVVEREVDAKEVARRVLGARGAGPA
jgi:CheY-like chemotaxis protein